METARNIKNKRERRDKVWLRQKKIKIGEKWWSWDKKEKDLRDKKGNLRGIT